MNLRELMGLPEPTVLRVKKLDAARRQLRPALTMFLKEEDPVPIHALASAAQDVLRGILKAKGEQGSFIKDTDWVKPEGAKLWHHLTHHEQHFFKHADRDPDGVLEFKLQLLPFTLVDCVKMYSDITGRMLREGSAYMMWYMREFPDRLKPGPFAEAMRAAGPVERASILLILNARDHEIWSNTD